MTSNAAQVRAGTPADVAAAVQVARQLPTWFTPRGLDHMAIDLRFQAFVVAAVGRGSEGDARALPGKERSDARSGQGLRGGTPRSDDRVIGFASFYVAEAVAWLGWLGVAPAHHRQGVGRDMVEHVCAKLTSAGVSAVRVDTLGDSVDYPPYATTRAFYAGLGFVQHARVMQDDPEWPDRLTLGRSL